MIPVEEQSPEQGDSDLDFEPGPTEDSGSDSQVSDAEPTSPPRLPWFGRGQSVVPMPSPARPPGFSRGAYVVSRSLSGTTPGRGRGRGMPPGRRGTRGSRQLTTPLYVGAATGETAQPGVGASPTFTLPMTAVPTLASQYVCHSQVSISVILLLELLKWVIFS